MQINNFIKIDGKTILFSNLTKEEQKEISEKLNVNAAEQIGYIRTA